MYQGRLLYVVMLAELPTFIFYFFIFLWFLCSRCLVAAVHTSISFSLRKYLIREDVSAYQVSKRGLEAEMSSLPNGPITGDHSK